MVEARKPGFRIETDRLVLREWVAGDAVRFGEVTNTPAVMKWLGGPLDAETLANTERRMLAFQADYGHAFWLVERHDDGGHLAGELLGFCGLKRADAPTSTFAGQFEIGWRLREEAWGKGYAKEAATASLDAGFGEFAAPEIVAITVIGNTASWGLMERLGMRRRIDLDFHDPRYGPPLCDVVAWSITADEWRNRPA